MRQNDLVWWNFQKKILNGQFWNVEQTNLASSKSFEFGPEMIFTGKNYFESPIRIVFLGYNPFYKKDEELVFTKKWIEAYFKKSIDNLDFSDYEELKRIQQDNVLKYDYITGQDAIPDYTMPKIIERVYNLYSECKKIQDPQIMKQIQRNLNEFTTQSIVWMNAIPFEGKGESGNIDGSVDKAMSLKYISEALELLSPDIIFVFHSDIMEWFLLTKTQKVMNFQTPDWNWLDTWEKVAFRKNLKEKWIYLYHFSKRNAQLKPMETFIEYPLEWIRKINAIQKWMD